MFLLICSFSSLQASVAVAEVAAGEHAAEDVPVLYQCHCPLTAALEGAGSSSRQVGALWSPRMWPSPSSVGLWLSSASWPSCCGLARSIHGYQPQGTEEYRHQASYNLDDVTGILLVLLARGPHCLLIVGRGHRGRGCGGLVVVVMVVVVLVVVVMAVVVVLPVSRL